ncbi:protein SHORT-ROOT 1-like [Phalaenopsis equestris]|uniref:protein SHORT-ROOT 1-like n=1 Tax=Phalaenopsis equestris TaxID=78828 RepID=UPI0009E1B66D|nr:protein SHORT-ROOT 1-like [Phalaenopsis equestris]
MDTLFRLVSLHPSDDQNQHQQSSFNSSRTSSSSRSSLHPPYHQYLPSTSYFELSQEEECCFINPHHPSPYFYNKNSNFFMDEDFSSSSSSSRHFQQPARPPHHLPPIPDLFSDPNRRCWASDLLLDCARAVASRDSSRVQQLMWMLNELASPYGDLDQKLAFYFLQALFARLTSSGPRTLRTLSSASDRSTSFDSTRRNALRFQELSPWSSFGHLAANGAILESFLHSSPPTRLHILDLSTTFCTQWPTLLEALATRSAADEDTPHLSITTVIPSTSQTARRVMREISARMEKFARLMAVPFRFSVVHHPHSDLSTLDLDTLISHDSSSPAATLAVNCVNSLHGVPPSARRRDILLAKISSLRPRIVTVVEEEAELEFDEEDEERFLKGFREALRFFSAYFETLEESFPKTSNERLALERGAGRAMVDLVACPADQSAERRETAAGGGGGGGWSRRMRMAGFSPLGFSDDLADDLRALLRRYKEGWSMRAAVGTEEAEESTSSGGGGGGRGGAGMFLTWKEEAVVWVSAWKV